MKRSELDALFGTWRWEKLGRKADARPGERPVKRNGSWWVRRKRMDAPPPPDPEQEPKYDDRYRA